MCDYVFSSWVWPTCENRQKKVTKNVSHKITKTLVKHCFFKSDSIAHSKKRMRKSFFRAFKANLPFLVICSSQSTQYYDMRWSCEHLIMVWINAFVMLMSQLLPPSYCDLLHRSAAHLGRWQKLEHGSYSNAPQHVWVALCVHRSTHTESTLLMVYV